MPNALDKAKAALHIASDDVFLQWHYEEKAYLTSLKKEPEIDVLKTQYILTLQKLRAAEYTSFYLVLFSFFIIFI